MVIKISLFKTPVTNLKHNSGSSVIVRMQIGTNSNAGPVECVVVEGDGSLNNIRSSSSSKNLDSGYERGRCSCNHVRNCAVSVAVGDEESMRILCEAERTWSGTSQLSQLSF